jgi:hypothetical protein
MSKAKKKLVMELEVNDLVVAIYTTSFADGMPTEDTALAAVIHHLQNLRKALAQENKK